MKVSKNLQKNIDEVQKLLNSDDIEMINLSVKNKKACLFFAREIVDKTAIGELILKPLSSYKKKMDVKSILSIFLCPEKDVEDDIEKAIDCVSFGNGILFIDGISSAFSFGVQKFEKRAITEPPSSTVIKGPREGFVESLPVNVSLMRRKIKSPDLRFINTMVGKYSKTPVAICYIKGIADEKIVRQIQAKIKKIQIDAVLDSSYVAKFLGSHKYSLFKQVGDTEKPDILASRILEGRVAIFVDGSPIVLTVPYLLVEEFQSPSDYYSSALTATTARAIRLISVFISLFLPAFFVSAELFHLQLIPLNFLLTIVNSIKGIPLTPSYEMFFTLLIFEILNEASIRMPKYVGMVVSIVGGLVLGETAVTAGIISAPTLMIIALSGICLYTVPELEKTFSLLRIGFLFIGGTFGIYSIFVGIVILVIYLTSFENFSTPLLAPFSPLVKSDLKDGFIKTPLIKQNNRPISINRRNKNNPNRLKTKGEV